MILTNYGLQLYKVILKAKATALFSRWTHAVPSMYGERPSAQSRAKAWTVNTPTRPCPSKSKVILCPLRVGEGRAGRAPRKPLKRAKILFTDIWNQRRGDTHVMGDTCDDGPIKVQERIRNQPVSKCERVCGPMACAYEPNSLDCMRTKATEHNKPWKVFTLQRHCFDSTGRRPGWK